MAPSSSLAGTLPKKSYYWMVSISLSYVRMFPKRLVLICFPCGVLYELFHYASNTILYPHPSLLPEPKDVEDRWIGDLTGKCLVVWVCFSWDVLLNVLVGACNHYYSCLLL